MMMRSMSPISAHLAERPVPAPPPTMGMPEATCLRNRDRISERECMCFKAESGMENEESEYEAKRNARGFSVEVRKKRRSRLWLSRPLRFRLRPTLLVAWLLILNVCHLRGAC